MTDDFGHTRPAQLFKLLTVVGCAGTLVFLLLEAYRENVKGEWRDWQEQYAARLDPALAASFESGVKQAFVPGLGSVDRCQSCHVGIDDPAMATAEVPLRSHPGDLLAVHRPEDFGCTVCHQGQGRALSEDAAHGEVPHWEHPLLRGEMVYTSCGRCHAENGLYGQDAELFASVAPGGEIFRGELSRQVAGARLLNRGKELVLESGCLGCHVYQGKGGTLGPELTHVGDKGVHGYDFSHLPPGVARTPLDWLREHFADPGAMSPGTVMPGFGVEGDDAEALAVYMLSLQSRDVPAGYRAAPRGDRGEAASGRDLYELFCVSCHGRDLAGSEVPEIRTPSLSNEDFLSVADADYLRFIIRHGRSGTEMPAWGADSGGLNEAQIDRIVDYILSYEPRHADLADVSARRGDPGMGRHVYRGRCASCHGVDGEGGVGTRLNSPDFLAVASDEFLLRTILDGRLASGMPSWRNLRAQNLSDLLAFLRTWGNAGADVAQIEAHLASDAVDAALGGRIFRARCSKCHGASAEGGVGPSLDNPAFLSIASDGYLARAILDGRPGTAMPAWRELAAADVGDLVAWLRSRSDVEYAPAPDLALRGDPEHGALLFGRACASCHGKDAVGGVGPRLRNPVFLDSASDGFLYQTVAYGRPGTPMRGFLKGSDEHAPFRYGAAGVADLSRAQVADVVAWLRSLQHSAPAAEPPHAVLGSASRGREIYEETASCAKCHGYEGQGGVGPALGNRDFLAQANEGYLIATMVLGRSGTEMRNFDASGLAHLQTADLMDVAAYVRTLGQRIPEGRGGWRRYEATADQVDQGRALFSQYCASCHGVNGRGGYAPELNNPEFLAAASDGHLMATIARGRIGTPMRPFGAGPASLADLTHEQIRFLVGYLRSWESTPGSEGSPLPLPLTSTVTGPDPVPGF